MNDAPALTDPQLRRAVETRLGWLRQRPGWVFWRRRGSRREYAELKRIWHILSQYPWQVYPYRYGRWQRVQRIIDLGYPSFKWNRIYDTFQLLDPSTGRPIAELTARSCTLPKPSGVLRFAGDPHVAGVYTPATGGNDALRLALSAFADEKVIFAEALQIRPGRSTTGDSHRHNGQLLADDERRPWIADHPDRPKHT